MARSKSPELSGPRKRKPSNKARTNGDPLQAQKRKKKVSTVNKLVTAALTQNKTATGPSNTGRNQLGAPENVSGTQDEDSPDSEDIIMVDLTLKHAQNISSDAAGDRSDNESNSSSENKNNEDEEDDNTNVEAAEESAETELGIKIIFASN